MKRQQIRFIFKYQHELYKFLSIFTSNHNSFHFHLYEESDKPFKYFNSSFTEENKLKIDIENPVSSHFIRHKFTFHKSGYIHSTKKNSDRYIDGVKGISFNEIETSNLVLLLSPRKIELLKKYKYKKDGHNFIIPIEEKQTPFSFNFEIFKKSSLNNLPTIPTEIMQGPHTYHWDDLEFGLRFYFQKIIGANKWPESTLVLKRILK